MVRRKVVTLTDAQIKALPITPIELVAAPGANKVITLSQCFLSFPSPVSGYTNIDVTGQFQFGWIRPGGFLPCASGYAGGTYILDGSLGDDAFVQFPNTDSEFSADSVVNRAFGIALYNAAAGVLTGGNAANTLKAIVYYEEVDLS